MLNFQKQFDTITGALNIFDLSFLVSGATMLGVLVYAIPELKSFVYHSSQVTLSVCIDIVFIYVLGMISWTAGKQFRYMIMQIFDGRTNEDDFKSEFYKAVNHFEFQNEALKKMISKDCNVAYSYMWMKLDNSKDADCQSRFRYASRFWVLRAIYEGLIPPVILFAITLYVRTLYKYTWDGAFCLIFVLVLTTVIVGLLAKEARKCANTQIREVVMAYCNFIEKKSM